MLRTQNKKETVSETKLLPLKRSFYVEKNAVDGATSKNNVAWDYFQHEHTVVILGPLGAGKSSVFLQAAEACGFRFDPATYSESYPATVPIIIRPPFRKLSGHCSDLIRPHLVVEDQG
ncbi:MAG: hypothetical protein P4L53_05465, partial [Candidatus Obscuribacterales bacterium]|nr:hypothetical protein [Candidatus Obscuribacterales bacterium]